MARIAIVGVGAIGGAIAGLLEMAGEHEIPTPLNRMAVALLDVLQPGAR